MPASVMLYINHSLIVESVTLSTLGVGAKLITETNFIVC